MMIMTGKSTKNLTKILKTNISNKSNTLSVIENLLFSRLNNTRMLFVR